MLHDGVGIDTGEDEALLEGVVEATVLGMGEPDEIGSSVVGRDAVEMMDFVAASELRADPCERHKSVASSTSCLSDREVVLSPSAAISSVDSISVWFNGTQARQNFCKLNNKKKPDFLMEEIRCKGTAFI